MSDTTTEPSLPSAKTSKGAGYWIRRIGIGVAGVAGTSVLVFAPGGYAVALSLALMALLGTRELFVAIRAREKAVPTEWLAYVACILFQVIAMLEGGRLDEYRQVVTALRLDQYRDGVIALLLGATLLAELVKPRISPIENIGATLIGALYVGWLFSFLTLIRVAQYPFVHSPFSHFGPISLMDSGAWMMIYIIAITWAGDTGGLFAGYVLGRRKLAPAISPAKTLEGAIGGLALAVVVAMAFGRWIGVPIEHAVNLGLLVGGFGLLGDLCESAMKRELGIKDFSRFFGNHGGVLDRCDSLLFTGPVAYYYMIVFHLLVSGSK